MIYRVALLALAALVLSGATLDRAAAHMDRAADALDRAADGIARRDEHAQRAGVESQHGDALSADLRQVATTTRLKADVVRVMYRYDDATRDDARAIVAADLRARADLFRSFVNIELEALRSIFHETLEVMSAEHPGRRHLERAADNHGLVVDEFAAAAAHLEAAAEELDRA